MRFGTKLLAASAAVVLTLSSAFAQSRGITAEDYFALKFLNDLRFSPDGSKIAFVVGTIDQKQNRRYNAIWTVSEMPGILEVFTAVMQLQPWPHRLHFYLPRHRK